MLVQVLGFACFLCGQVFWCKDLVIVFVKLSFSVVLTLALRYRMFLDLVYRLVTP